MLGYNSDVTFGRGLSIRTKRRRRPWTFALAYSQDAGTRIQESASVGGRRLLISSGYLWRFDPDGRPLWLAGVEGAGGCSGFVAG